jgi:methionyl-tRNA formyltransferase
MPANENTSTTAETTLRLVMMGTGPFAVPTFESLLNSGHSVLGLVTRPDRPAHRREKTPLNPMRAVAQVRGLEVFEPESINSNEAHAWLGTKGADLFVVCDYGQILSRETLALARLGGINLHASLLPKYRGAAPINWAIYHGETETGVTVIHMTPQLDAGPAIVQRRTAISSNETAPEIEARLANLGSTAVLEAVEMFSRGGIASGIEQDPAKATKAPRLKKEDGLVDWSRPATAISNQVRALQPWPKTYTFWKRPELEPVRLILEQVQAVDRASVDQQINCSPGTVATAQGENFIVACGKGLLRIERFQPAGKKAMSAGEFLRGHPLQPGDRLG